MSFDLLYRSPRPLSAAERAHMAFWRWLEDPELPVRDWADPTLALPAEGESPGPLDALIRLTLELAIGTLRGEAPRAATPLRPRAGDASDHCAAGLRIEHHFWAWLRDPARALHPSLHPEWRAISHELGPLVDVVSDPALADAPGRWRALAQAIVSLQRGFAAPAGTLGVDLTHGRLSCGGRISVARPLVALLAHFARRKVVSEAEIAGAIFGLRRFEEAHHRRKLSNLLSDARQVLPPGAQLLYSGGEVHALGDWSSVRYWRESPLLLAARELPAAAPARAPSPELGPLLARQPSWTRSELQSALGLSRSAAVRLVRALLDERRLVATGAAKQRRYQVTPRNAATPRLP